MAFTFGNGPNVTAVLGAQVPSFDFATPAAAASTAAPPAFGLGAPAMGGCLTAPIAAGTTTAWYLAATAAGGWPAAAQQTEFEQQTAVTFTQPAAASASAQAP